jgi:hypothetical protein
MMHETPLAAGSRSHPKPAGSAGRDGLPPQFLRDRGAKRIRSLYLPRMTGVTPKLSTTALPKGLASLSTINAATMRLCRADLPASHHPRSQQVVRA